MWRTPAAGVVAAAILFFSVALYENDQDPGRGRSESFTVLAGAAFGILLQRSRFCFASAFRDLLVLRDRRVAMGILAALAAGSVGHAVVLVAQYPHPAYLPLTAHIAPASWVMILGGAAFGTGMVLAGGCISGNLYRLGEGSLVAPVGLIFTGVGFWLGFASWNFLYVKALAATPVVWLPQHLGYGGATALQLAALAGLAALLLWKGNALPAPPGDPLTLRGALRKVGREPWPAWVGGAAIGMLGTFAFLRTHPLGVTAEIGRLSKRAGTALGFLPARLEGLDRMAGCRAIEGGPGLSENGMFVLALVGGSLLAALVAGEFRLRGGRPRTYVLAAIGGVLLGFGAMISLGCTVGTLLSGIMAFSLHGWMFAAGLAGGAWAGTRILRKLA